MKKGNLSIAWLRIGKSLQGARWAAPPRVRSIIKIFKKMSEALNYQWREAIITWSGVDSNTYNEDLSFGAAFEVCS